MKTWMSFIVFGSALAWLPAAVAQPLQDPTRPPNMLMQAGGVPSASGEPVLQSVFISPTRRVAIISGQTVKLGDQFGGSTLVKITESEVSLRKGGELQTLKLFPNMGKKLTPAPGRQYSRQLK